jgi:hypothetical protein
VNVACTWAAIGAAIKAAGSGNTIIKVAPGTLPGNGMNATSKEVLTQLGSVSRSNRILVTAANGWGSVKTSGSVRISLCGGITFDLIDFTNQNGILLSGCTDVALSRCRGSHFGVYGVDGYPAQQIELVECVTPVGITTSDDAWAFRTSSGSNAGIDGVDLVGCYVAAYRRPAGSTAHEDSLQLSGTGNNTYGNIALTDTVIFSANNSAFQIGSGYNLSLDHSLLIGNGALAKLRYPDLSSADNDLSGAKAINGGGYGGMSATDSIMIGSFAGPTWNSVSNTRVNSPSATRPTSGAWTQDTSLAKWGIADLNSNCPNPTDALLASIWS